MKSYVKPLLIGGLYTSRVYFDTYLTLYPIRH